MKQTFFYQKSTSSSHEADDSKILVLSRQKKLYIYLYIPKYAYTILE